MFSARGVRRPLLVIAVCGLAAAANAGDGAVGGPPDVRPGVLNLRTGDVATATLPNLLRQGDFGDAHRHVVQLDGPITPARRAALQVAGVRLGQYLPTNSIIADLSASNPGALAALGFVTWVGPYADEWKIDPLIGQRDFATVERQELFARGEVALVMHLFDGEPVQPAIDALNALPNAVVFNSEPIGDSQTITLTIPSDQLQNLAQIPSLQFVEELGEYTNRNNSNRWIVQSTTPNATPFYANGIRGEGQILGHLDDGLGPNHCSFLDSGVPFGPAHRKVVAYNRPVDYWYHGTHTAGTAVGDGGTDSNTRGVAYMGKLVHNRYMSWGVDWDETGMATRLNQHHGQGARVHTNSWGDDGTVQYNGVCRAIDNYSWQNDDGLVLFAVTNQFSLKNPENAKNCLAVGASMDYPNFNSHCSGGGGPTNDQRRKPEIYAPGCDTISSASSSGCSTGGSSGTSMACPAVAGVAMLVRQYYTDGYYPSGAANPSDGFNPSGALLKATLINASQDMTSIGGYPSNTEGWGRVAADQAAFFPGDARTLIVHDQRNNAAGALTTGVSHAQEFTVDSSSEQLRITLAWHDAPAAANASAAAINNLDLVVTSPGGDVYKGNVFSGGVSVTGGSADLRNNLEQVHINNPAAGEWTVEILGTAVNVGEQGFALVITGGVEAASACAADFDGDGTLTLNDFVTYRNAYTAGDLAADFDGDGLLTLNDFVQFRNAYTAGCP